MNFECLRHQKIRWEADNAAGERYYLLSNLSACITADMISGWPRPPRSVRDETANLSSPPPSSVWSLRRIYRVDNHSEEQRLTTLQAGSTCQSCHTSRRLWCLNGSGLHQSPLTCPPPPERFWRWWRRGKVTNRLAKKKKLAWAALTFGLNVSPVQRDKMGYFLINFSRRG